MGCEGKRGRDTLLRPRGNGGWWCRRSRRAGWVVILLGVDRGRVRVRAWVLRHDGGVIRRRRKLLWVAICALGALVGLRRRLMRVGLVLLRGWRRSLDLSRLLPCGYPRRLVSWWELLLMRLLMRLLRRRLLLLMVLRGRCLVLLLGWGSRAVSGYFCSLEVEGGRAGGWPLLEVSRRRW